jgi:two-component system, NtrC family, sensor histidine kinase GlrK
VKVIPFFSVKLLFLAGFLLALIPLIAGVLLAARTMDDIAESGRAMNYQMYEQTKTVGLVLQKTSDIERKARLFVLLADPSLRQPYERDSYETARTAFHSALGELQRLSVDNTVVLLANELAEKEGLIYRQIIESDSSSQPRLPVDQAFRGLREAAIALSSAFENHVNLEFNQLRQQSSAREHGLLTRFGMLLGVSVVIIYGVLMYLERAFRRLDAAIRRLGTTDHEEAITLSGPVDFIRMGRHLEMLRHRLLAAGTVSQAATEAAGPSATAADEAGVGVLNSRILEGIEAGNVILSKETPEEP